MGIIAPKQVSILAVDDDVRVLRLEQRILEKAGYCCSKAQSGEEALEVLEKANPALVLLDIVLPGMDGFTACERIRQLAQVPIIIVASNAHEADKVRALELGSDDYITKPFWPKELVARIHAVLRRCSIPSLGEEPALTIGDMVVEFAKNKVTLTDQEVYLSATEYRLLSYLAVNAGRILTSSQILEQVWGETSVGDTTMLRMAISRLRDKLGDDVRNPRYVLTRSGIGYTLSLDASRTVPDRGNLVVLSPHEAAEKVIPLSSNS